jgi:hypothetical protein
MTHHTKYGNQPFEKVTKAEYELRGLETLRQGAYLQYKLMLLKPVLRANVNFAKKSLVVEYVEPKEASALIEKAIKPVKLVPKSKESVDYKDIVKAGYHE